MKGTRKKKEEETISLPDSLFFSLSLSLVLAFDIVVCSSLVMVTNIVRVEKNG